MTRIRALRSQISAQLYIRCFIQYAAPVELRLRQSEVDFRDRLRAWLTETVPALPAAPAHDDWPARRAYDTAWQRALFDAGYAGVEWPREHGGLGATPTEQLIFLEETATAGAPYIRANLVG